MLPKQDKSKKSFPSDENDNKTERLAEEKKRLQKKRRLIVISIILTVGLSFSFWIYRSVKNFLDNPDKPKFALKINLPKINFSQKKISNFDFQIKKNLSSNFQNISLYIADDNQESPFIYQQNESPIFEKQDIKDIQTKINSLTPTDKSLLNINLPVGLTFQEIISEKSGFDYFNQINLPGKKLLILIHLDNKQDISSLIESIYWDYIQQSN